MICYVRKVHQQYKDLNDYSVLLSWNYIKLTRQITHENQLCFLLNIGYASFNLFNLTTILRCIFLIFSMSRILDTI